MGVYRLYTGSDGESHIEEIKAEALQNIKVTGTMSFSVQERAPGTLWIFIQPPFGAGKWVSWDGRPSGSPMGPRIPLSPATSV